MAPGVISTSSQGQFLKTMMKHYSCNITTTAGIFAFVLCSGFLVGFSEAGREIREALSGEEMAEAAGYGMEKLSTVLVTGSVACDACLAGNIATHPHPVSGAVVGVACRTGHRKRAVRAKGVTDRYGDFIIDLPSDLHADPYLYSFCYGASNGDQPIRPLFDAVAQTAHLALSLVWQLVA